MRRARLIGTTIQNMHAGRLDIERHGQSIVVCHEHCNRTTHHSRAGPTARRRYTTITFALRPNTRHRMDASRLPLPRRCERLPYPDDRSQWHRGLGSKLCHMGRRPEYFSRTNPELHRIPRTAVRSGKRSLLQPTPLLRVLYRHVHQPGSHSSGRGHQPLSVRPQYHPVGGSAGAGKKPHRSQDRHPANAPMDARCQRMGTATSGAVRGMARFHAPIILARIDDERRTWCSQHDVHAAIRLRASKQLSQHGTASRVPSVTYPVQSTGHKGTATIVTAFAWVECGGRSGSFQGFPDGPEKQDENRSFDLRQIGD